MKTVAAGYIQIQIGVVHTVQSPEYRGMMKQEMLEINDEIKEDNAQKYFEPGSYRYGIEKPPATYFDGLCQCDRENGKQELEQSGVDDNQGEIGTPASAFVVLQGTPWCDGFPESYCQKSTGKNGNSYGLFSRHTTLLR
jgi:hypothetical protein